MSRRDDTIAVRHMLEHAREALGAVHGRTRNDLDGDHLFALALVKLVEIIGEAAKRVSAPVQKRHGQIPWSQIVGTRNRLVHGYDQIDFDVLWRIIHDELPSLINQLEAVLAEESPSGS
jgi:uncharacterized protein with HEPN domain